MPELRLTRTVHDELVAHCLAEYPLEGCGLLGVDAQTADAVRCYPTRNAAKSARVYTVDPLDHLRADREAEASGFVIGGVFHSHTHTEAYPSPTDVDRAPDPNWHYVLVSLAQPEPVVRSFRIVDGRIEEETVVVEA